MFTGQWARPDGGPCSPRDEGGPSPPAWLECVAGFPPGSYMNLPGPRAGPQAVSRVVADTGSVAAQRCRPCDMSAALPAGSPCFRADPASCSHRHAHGRTVHAVLSGPNVDLNLMLK